MMFNTRRHFPIINSNEMESYIYIFYIWNFKLCIELELIHFIHGAAGIRPGDSNQSKYNTNLTINVVKLKLMHGFIIRLHMTHTLLYVADKFDYFQY